MQQSVLHLLRKGNEMWPIKIIILNQVIKNRVHFPFMWMFLNRFKSLNVKPFENNSMHPKMNICKTINKIKVFFADREFCTINIWINNWTLYYTNVSLNVISLIKSDCA